MMKIISIMNQKGGVGKTVITHNLGRIFAARGYRTLLVDLDHQSNLTFSLNMCYFADDTDFYNNRSYSDLNLKQTTLSLAEMFDTKRIEVEKIDENLFLVPNEVSFAAQESKMAGTVARELVLKRLLKQVKDDYDICIIDCPPALGNITTNAFVASDYLIAPVTSFFSIQALRDIQSHVKNVNYELDHELKIIGVVLNMFDKRLIESRKAEETIADCFKELDIFNTKISKSEEIRKSERSHALITSVKIKSEFEELASEIIDKIKL